MSEPIVFISHQRIKEGKLDAYKQLFREYIGIIKADKPGTVAHLAYINEDGSKVTMVHVFPDAEAMDLHFQGVDERAKKAFEFIEIIRYEIYGRPSDMVLEMMQQFAGSNIVLDLNLEHMGGYLRLKSG
jgi:quinol monooxygenase YgiN